MGALGQRFPIFAKRRITYIENVPKIMKMSDEFSLWSCCEKILSFAAPYSFLRDFIDKNRTSILATGNDVIRESISRILSEALALWSIPFMVEIRETVEDWGREEDSRWHRYISFILCHRDESFSFSPNILPDADPETTQMHELLSHHDFPYEYDYSGFNPEILDRYSAIVSNYKNCDIQNSAFLYGKLFSLTPPQDLIAEVGTCNRKNL